MIKTSLAEAYNELWSRRNVLLVTYVTYVILFYTLDHVF
jgi:hypothetical protein